MKFSMRQSPLGIPESDSEPSPDVETAVHKEQQRAAWGERHVIMYVSFVSSPHLDFRVSKNLLPRKLAYSLLRMGTFVPSHTFICHNPRSQCVNLWELITPPTLTKKIPTHDGP